MNKIKIDGDTFSLSIFYIKNFSKALEKNMGRGF